MTRADHLNGTVAHPRGARPRSAPTPTIVVNLQGDLPTVDAGDASAPRSRPLADPAVDIATICRRDRPRRGAHRPERGQGRRHAGRADAASSAPSISPAPPRPGATGPLYHHIGLYAYRRAALERYVALPPSPLEQREKLEQLRALEAGMRIDVAIVDAVPLGVDTPADLERAGCSRVALPAPIVSARLLILRT